MSAATLLVLLAGIALPVFAQNASTQEEGRKSQDAYEIESPDRSLTGFEAIDEAQPLWEFGAGGGFVEVPNYPASSERNFVALAAPYVIYRGDVFRLGGGGGVRAVVVEERDFEVDLSLGGAFSADSDDNTVREGMPELDFLFEIGPQLIYRVRDYEFDGGGNARLNLRMQARAVFSTDFERIDDRGYVFEPQLSYQQRGVLFADTAFNASLSFVFASEDLHDYFYQVDEQFVTSDREAFDASGGYLGAELNVGISFPIMKNMRGFAGGSLRFHQGAANEDSPLFEDDLTYSIGLGFVWRLYQSDAKANW
ncbi:MipA/OmpV family protein [Ningiella sp. W23]|uniref:MipA/OmpV family protein n=1 Tax=Ningiella sp. W23 TaxID=3023715 RepID=UPI003757D812